MSKNSHSWNKAKETDKEKPSEIGAVFEEQAFSKISRRVSPKLEKPHKNRFEQI